MAGAQVLSKSITEVIENLLFEAEKRFEKKDSAADEFAVDAYNLACDIDNRPLIFKAARQLSQFYTDLNSAFPKSIELLEAAIERLDDEEDAEHKAELHRLLGLNCDYQGQLTQSKYAYDESIRLLQSKADLSQEGKHILARSQFNLSIIYGRLELPSLSDESLNKAYEQYKQLGEKNGIARCYISFGANLEERGGSKEEAYEFYKKAADLSREIKDDVSLSVALGNMAVKLAEKGEFDQALLAAFEALEKATKSANKRFQLNLCRQIGRCYHLKKEYKDSQHWFAEGEKIFKELQLKIDYYNLFGYWSAMLYDAGNYREACDKMKLAEKHQEEMHVFHKNAAVNDAMLRFQLEEGKKEQDALKKKTIEIEEYARKLEASNFELKQFTHAASHDMKEPLRMISNYSQLLEKTMNQQLTQEQREYLKYLGDGAKRLMNVLNNLIEWSNINPSVITEEVDIALLLEEVKQSLISENGDMTAIIRYVNMPKVQTGLIAMRHIFTHLIDNGVKYNLNELPEIEINCSEQSRHYLFSVDDNGIGIPEEYRQKVFIIFQRLHARDEYGGAGIGLTVCKKIIDNLNGKIWIEPSLLGGTKVCFTIPK